MANRDRKEALVRKKERKKVNQHSTAGQRSGEVFTETEFIRFLPFFS